MTIKQGEALLSNFITAATINSNPFLIAHFSRQDDQYRGYHEGLDRLDAAIIIRELVQHFKMTEIDAATMGFKPVFQPEY